MATEYPLTPLCSSIDACMALGPEARKLNLDDEPAWIEAVTNNLTIRRALSTSGPSSFLRLKVLPQLIDKNLHNWSWPTTRTSGSSHVSCIVQTDGYKYHHCSCFSRPSSRNNEKLSLSSRRNGRSEGSQLQLPPTILWPQSPYFVAKYLSVRRFQPLLDRGAIFPAVT